MKAKEAVSSAVTSVEMIERYFEKNWGGFFKTIKSLQNNNCWRESRLKMFGADAQDFRNRRKFQYLAASESSLNYANIQRDNLARKSGAWQSLPSADWACLALAWKDSPVILNYESELMRCLQESDIDEGIHISESLRCLPYDCFYIASEGLEFKMLSRNDRPRSALGYFVEKEWIPLSDQQQRVEEHLIITLISSNGKVVPLVVPMYLPRFKDIVGNVTNTFAKVMNKNPSDLRKSIEEDLRMLINPLLYIASGEPDIVEYGAKDSGGAKESIINRKSYSWSEDEKDKPVTQFIIGSNFRPEYDQSTNRNDDVEGKHHMAPHIRRGHFHTYIMGSRKENKTRRVLRWVEPTPVNMENEENPIIVRTVK